MRSLSLTNGLGIHYIRAVYPVYLIVIKDEFFNRMKISEHQVGEYHKKNGISFKLFAQQVN